MLIVSAVFPPEALTSARTACDVAEEMTRRGHDVNVFAPFPNRPAGRFLSGYSRSWRQVEHRDGYRIVRSWHTLSQRSTLWSRSAENLSFGFTSTWRLLREAKADVVFLNTWPLFSQWLNTLVFSWRRVPMVCAVKDVYPETHFSGESRYNPAVWFAKGIDGQVLRRSSMVVPLNSVTADHLIATRRLDHRKVRVVPDWVDAAPFRRNLPRDGNFREKLDLPKEVFLAMYVGSLTRAAGLEVYVEAARRLRQREDLRIVLVGDGSMRAKLETAVRKAGLTNIKIIYPLQPDDVPEVQAAADVLMLSLAPGVAALAIPSKLVFYMFSQRAILASVRLHSAPAQILREAECGYVVPQRDSQALATRLAGMADDRNSLQDLGTNARRYAEQQFTKDTVMPQMCDLLEQVAGSQAQSIDG